MSAPSRRAAVGEALWARTGRRAAPEPSGVGPAPRLLPGADVRALGYVRLEDARGGEFGRHLRAIERLAGGGDLRVSDVVCDVADTWVPGTERQGLRWALGRLAAGEAVALVVPRLEHLEGAFDERTGALRWFRQRGLILLAADVRAEPPAAASAAARTVTARAVTAPRVASPVASSPVASPAAATASVASSPAAPPPDASPPARRERGAGTAVARAAADFAGVGPRAWARAPERPSAFGASA
jgi:hypothetical protein